MAQHKQRTRMSMAAVVVAAIVLSASPKSSAEDEFVLHPGYISGTVSVPGHTVNYLSLYATAYDPVAGKSYTASLYLSNPSSYTLVVEAGNWTYTVHYSVYFDGTNESRVSLQRRVAPAEGETITIDVVPDAVIEGTVSVAGQTVTRLNMQANAYSVPAGHPQYGASTQIRVLRPAGATTDSLGYSIPIFGGDALFRVYASSVRLTNANDYLSLSYKDAGPVAVGGSGTADWHVTPGYVEGKVTVNGASIASGEVGAEVRDPVTNRSFYATTRFGSDGNYRMPAPPGTNVRVYGTVVTGPGSYGLIDKVIDVVAGETTSSVNWTIDLDGKIAGEVAITGVNFDRVVIYGYGPNGAHRNLTLYTEGAYLFDGLLPGEWGIRTYAYDEEYDWAHGYYNVDYYYFPLVTVDVAPGGSRVDFSLDAGYIERELLSENSAVRDDLYYGEVRAYAEGYDYPTSSSEYAYSQEQDTSQYDLVHGDINSFHLFVAPGQWQIRSVYLRLMHPQLLPSGAPAPFPANYNATGLSITEYDQAAQRYSLPWLSVGATEVVETGPRYETAQIRARMVSTAQVFRSPQVTGQYRYNQELVRDRSVTLTGSTNAQDVHEALVVLDALPGWYELTAQAYVGATWVTFGQPYLVYVDPGDVLLTDAESPIVVLTSPPGNFETHEECVDVTGTVTDESGLQSFSINGTPVVVGEDGSFSLQVCGLGTGSNAIEIVATDTYGNTTSLTRTVIRINDLPVVVHGGPYSASEGSPVTFDASGSSDFEGSPLQFRWDLDGDGTWDTAWSAGASASHTWYDDYTGTARVSVLDDENAATAEAPVTVTNVAPSLGTVAAPTDPVARGASFDLTAQFTDPGTADTHTAAIDWGDGSVEAATVTESGGSGAAAGSHSYATSGPRTVTITVTDDDGGAASTSVVVVVNSPPVADAGGPYSADEGAQVTLDAGGSSDADGDALQFRWDYDNDGTWDTGWSSSAHATRTWNDSGTVMVAVEASDGDLTHQDTATVNIANLPPVITAVSATAEPVAVGEEVNLAGSFTDAGTGDTHTASVDWGDGAATAATVTEAGGSGTVAAAHSYTTPGVYALSLRVTDDDGGSATATHRYVVAYDPAGGFVTGGGHIDSPAGAYAPDLALAGKATFGFVAKYKKGAEAPDGTTEFQFHAASMNFHSSTYQWLVVAGAKAMFKGTGTVNGAGSYGFLISAIDGQASGGGGSDRFRIKIWDRNNGDEVVYDNQMGAAEEDGPTTALTAGSIQIHKG